MTNSPSHPGQGPVRNRYVVFCLGEIQFGVDVDQVVHIARLSPITRVPRAPRFLQGVVNHHGQVIPVVDLKQRLTLTDDEPYGDKARIIMVELEEHPFGMLVDGVVDILRLPPESIEPPTDVAGQVEGTYLTGVARQEGRIVFLLNLSQILTLSHIPNPIVETLAEERGHV